MTTTATKPMSVAEIDAQIGTLWEGYRMNVTGACPDPKYSPVVCLTLIDDLLDLRFILTH